VVVGSARNHGRDRRSTPRRLESAHDQETGTGLSPTPLNRPAANPIRGRRVQGARTQHLTPAPLGPTVTASGLRPVRPSAACAFPAAWLLARRHGTPSAWGRASAGGGSARVRSGRGAPGSPRVRAPASSAGRELSRDRSILGPKPGFPGGFTHGRGSDCRSARAPGEPGRADHAMRQRQAWWPAEPARSLQRSGGACPARSNWVGVLMHTNAAHPSGAVYG
jgi:hypothetical protein